MSNRCGGRGWPLEDVLSGATPSVAPRHLPHGLAVGEDLTALLRSLQLRPRRFAFTACEAVAGVVVDEAHRLHEGVASGGPDETEAAFAKVLAQGPGGFGFGFETHDRYGVSGMESVGSWGWGGAYGTYYRVDPAERLTTVLMVQMIPNNTDLTDKFKASIYQALLN